MLRLDVLNNLKIPEFPSRLERAQSRTQSSLAAINAIQGIEAGRLGLKEKQLQLANDAKKQATGEAIGKLLMENGGAIDEPFLRQLAQIPGGADVYPHYRTLLEQQQNSEMNRLLATRGAAAENYRFLAGTPGEPQQVGDPGMQTPPPVAGGLQQVAGVSVPLPVPENAPISSGYTGEQRHPSITLPGLPGTGVVAVSARPPNMREVFAEKQREREAQAELQRQGNIYTVTDPTTGKTITAPKDIIDNLITQMGENARKTPPVLDDRARAEHDFDTLPVYAEERKRFGVGGYLKWRDQVARDNAVAGRTSGESTREQARNDRGYQFESRRMDELAKPIEQRTTRLQIIRDSLDQNSPQADSLIAPELLTAMAGGAGSGLRMNEAEISRIIGGRNAWENLKSRVLRWQADPRQPFSIQPEQRKQIYDLIGTAEERNRQQTGLINNARQQLLEAEPEKQRRITADLQSQLASDKTLAPGGGNRSVNFGDLPR